jgi:hypothetical protein
MTKKEKLREIDATWDPIIEQQRALQGDRVAQLIEDAAQAEDEIPYEELEEWSKRNDR